MKPPATRPILHTVRGGSGWGVSTYRSWLNCEKRAWLDSQLAAGGRSNDSLETAVGTIYHALQEIYGQTQDRGLDTSVVEYVQDSGDPANFDEEARLQAENLFRSYRTQFAPNLMGKIVALEELLDGSDLAVPWKPAGLKLTARLDRVVKLTASDVIRIRGLRGLNLIPGIYGYDFKTAGARYANTADQYKADIQFMVYQLLWNALRPKQTMNGFLVDVAYKTKPPHFELIYVPPVGALEERIVAAFFGRALEAIGHDPPRANPDRCFMYYRICRHLVEGRCDRS